MYIWCVCVCVCVCVLVIQSCLTLPSLDYLAFQAPLSMGFSRREYGVSCHALLQGIFWPRGWTWASCIAGRFFTIQAPREALYMLDVYINQTQFL